jgi:hypothetical protein
MRPRQLDGRRVDDEYQNTCPSSKLRPYEFTRRPVATTGRRSKMNSNRRFR